MCPAKMSHPPVHLWRWILDKNVIGTYHKVHYIEFACVLSYRTRYAVMLYSVMLYCNRNTVLSYSVTLYRNQNSIVSYSDADVSYPVVIYRNLYAVVSYSVTWYRNLNDIVSYPMLLCRNRNVVGGFQSTSNMIIIMYRVYRCRV